MVPFFTSMTKKHLLVLWSQYVIYIIYLSKIIILSKFHTSPCIMPASSLSLSPLGLLYESVVHVPSTTPTLDFHILIVLCVVFVALLVDETIYSIWVLIKHYISFYFIFCTSGKCLYISPVMCSCTTKGVPQFGISGLGCANDIMQLVSWAVIGAANFCWMLIGSGRYCQITTNTDKLTIKQTLPKT